MVHLQPLHVKRQQTSLPIIEIFPVRIVAHIWHNCQREELSIGSCTVNMGLLISSSTLHITQDGARVRDVEFCYCQAMLRPDIYILKFSLPHSETTALVIYWGLCSISWLPHPCYMHMWHPTWISYMKSPQHPKYEIQLTLKSTCI